MTTATPNTKQQQRLMQVILAPVISEKSTYVADKHNQIVFRVAQDATKPEIKAAIEFMFSTKDKKLEVQSVKVVNVRGKEKRFGQTIGRRNHWKKAYVSLKPGQEINFADQAEAK
jgi:large subunit ribosomal protein L23